MAGRLRRDRVAIAALGLTLVALTATLLHDGSAGADARRALSLHRLGGFEAPVYVENAPGEPKLLFVVEQPGAVRVIRKGKTLKQPFLDIESKVEYGGEQGLLSIAFDPGYARNRRFYVYYVTNGGDIRVDMMRRKRKSPTRAEPDSGRRVIEIPHPSFENHNGGQLQFGPDGHLYLGPGDGGSAGDPKGNAQNPNVLLGKLLRVDPRHKGGYRTPSSNPFKGKPGRDEIYSLGLRNPWRFSFDAKTHDLLIADVGQNSWEEIDRVGLEAAGGANFGWDLFEGNHVFDGDGSQPANYKPPIHEYSSAGGGNCSITGGYVVRDPGLPALAGRYLYADLCAGQIRSLDPYAQNPSATDSSTGLSVNTPSSFGEGAHGRIYVAALDGGVFRIAG